MPKFFSKIIIDYELLKNALIKSFCKIPGWAMSLHRIEHDLEGRNWLTIRHSTLLYVWAVIWHSNADLTHSFLKDFMVYNQFPQYVTLRHFIKRRKTWNALAGTSRSTSEWLVDWKQCWILRLLGLHMAARSGKKRNNFSPTLGPTSQRVVKCHNCCNWLFLFAPSKFRVVRGYLKYPYYDGWVCSRVPVKFPTVLIGCFSGARRPFGCFKCACSCLSFAGTRSFFCIWLWGCSQKSYNLDFGVTEQVSVVQTRAIVRRMKRLHQLVFPNYNLFR